MRFTTRQNRGGKRLIMNMTSLIDVTFLLLVYFMVSTVMASPEDRLRPTIRTQDESASGSDADFQPQIVDVILVAGVPTYRLGQNDMTTASQLRDRLSNLPADLGVFIRGGEGVSVGFTMAAIQAARDTGFEQVTYVPLE
ncbi:MAG: biopolymer transporter ExbD [Planctomycetota bacterium]|nr:biopolymer transporter ExbD [Planctomycetota bacterium]